MKSSPAPKRRGFTLVELMVALSGGILFSVFVFMLTRDSARFFQSQAQTADTTLAAVSGFERLRSDIARAGYLASPNIARDRRRCPRPPTGGAVLAAQQDGADFGTYPGLQQMALARIIPNNTRANLNVGGFFSSNATLNPDQLVLYGNYATAEQFSVRVANFGGSPATITLESNSNPVRRLGLTGVPLQDQAILDRVFPGGGILRIVDNSNREQYGIINSVQLVAPDNSPQIRLEGPTIITKEAEIAPCGTKGLCVGCLVNPVNIVRYQLEDTSSDSQFPQFQYLHRGTGEAYDNTRLDLVRYTLPANRSNDVASSQGTIRETAEMIAEYAVDLRFGASVLQNTAAAAGTMNLLDEDDLTLQNFFGDPGAGAASAAGENGAHFIRSIYARMSVRSPTADRDAPVVPAGSPASALFRVQVDTNRFARLRTFRTHVATRNSRNFTWN